MITVGLGLGPRNPPTMVVGTRLTAQGMTVFLWVGFKFNQKVTGCYFSLGWFLLLT